MFDWVENGLQAKGLSALLFPVFKLSRENNAPEIVWHVWKGERCLCRSSRRKGSLKKMLWEISQNSQKTICAEISFFDKVTKSVDPQLH